MQAAEILREAALRVASYLLDGWVEPLVPASLALLGGLADEQRRDARPLVLAVLHDGRLEDLVLRVLPHAALYHDPHIGPLLPSASSPGFLLRRGQSGGIRLIRLPPRSPPGGAGPLRRGEPTPAWVLGFRRGGGGGGD